MAVSDCMRNQSGNPGRTAGGFGRRLLFDVRNQLAGMFGIPDTSRIIFTPNATTGINLAIRGILQDGDRVVTSSMEHNAVCRPLAALQKQKNIQVDVIQTSPEGYLDPDDLKRALNKPANLVVINHVSNVTGAVNDLKSLCTCIKTAGVTCMIDASQSAGVIPIDVEKDAIDILAAPGHKNLLGPTGTGFCYFSPDVNPEPLVFGGTGSYSELVDQPEHLPDRYEAGTSNFHGLAGLSAGIHYLLEQGFSSIMHKDNDTSRTILAGLQAIDGIKLHGPGHVERRMPVFSITCPGKDPADLANLLEEEFNLLTRVGLHCAPWAHRTANTYPEGTVRISPGLFHSREDLQYFLKSLDQAVTMLFS
jgi:cysteine desulfurase / selenocysteine lyase